METIVNATIARNVIGDSRFKPLHISVFILCLLTTMSEGYDIFLYGAVLPLLSKEWSLTSVQAGVIGSYGLVGMMLGSVLFGFFADRYGRKKPIVICIAVYSVFTMLCGFAPNAIWFSVFRFFAGLGVGGVLPNVIALATDYSPKHGQNTMVSIMLCGMQIGGILGPVASIATMDRYGWHAALWLGGIPFLLVPVMIKFMPDTVSYLIRKNETEKVIKILKSIQPELDWTGIRFDKEEITESKSGLKSLFQKDRSRSTVLFCFAYFMTLLIVYVLGTWIPELMIRMGYPFAGSLVFPMLLNVGCVIGTFAFAVIADRYLAPKKLLVLLYLVAACSLVLLGANFTIYVQYILAFIIGACTSGTQNIANAFVSRYYPSSVRSTGLGLCNGIGRMGAIFGTAFWGLLLQWNLPVFHNFLVFAIPALAAAASYFFAKVDDSEELGDEGGVQAIYH